ncbi:MAG: nitroreductase/quinone reductase family protein [Candidatus Nitrosocaldus sp.]|nr:nitroreductase/quinone reductase family protein [Candidatus Nitrosocaldus sp.]MDW7999421.1 nitroreductase/quinone reductase family protein [Candidatus Nitrosocaldus sp.]
MAGVEGESFIAYLITKGRRSGREHRVPLRLVRYNGRLYASRRNMESDWLKNILHDQHVAVEMDGERFEGTARLVDDEHLCRTISSLKYAGDAARAGMSRVVVEIEINSKE